MVICLERDADVYMAQLMPLPLTVSKIQIGFTFLVPETMRKCYIPHATGPRNSGRGKTANTEVVIVRRLYTFVDAVANTHAVSLERPVCRVTPTADRYQL